MCPLMQILAGSHYTKNFKCGLSTKCMLDVPNTVWPHDVCHLDGYEVGLVGAVGHSKTVFQMDNLFLMKVVWCVIDTGWIRIIIAHNSVGAPLENMV